MASWPEYQDWAESIVLIENERVGYLHGIIAKWRMVVVVEY